MDEYLDFRRLAPSHAVEQKDGARRELEELTEEFLARGGVIEELPPCVSTTGTNFGNRRKK